jgi:L,D-transpeptidase catalytic domain
MKKNLWKAAGIIVIIFSVVFLYRNTSAEFHKTLTVANNNRTHSENEKVSVKFYSDYIAQLYDEAQLADAGLDLKVFEKAVTGFYNLRKENKLSPDKSVITIIDYSKSSTQKRLWVIDLNKGVLLFNTLVAHGQGSGMDKATRFSNKIDSHESSLGFYITGETYIGDNGLSLKLDGVDPGYNTNARSRDIVMHGAAYVSRQFIHEFGRLGRSFGCPAVPLSIADTIINTIKNKTLLFINGHSSKYASHYLNRQQASDFLLSVIRSDDDGNSQS